MPTVSEEIITEAHKILKLCLKLQNVGIDAFFRWSPHIAWIEVDVYANGWQNHDNDSDKYFRVSFNKVDFDEDHVGKQSEITLKELQEIKNYLAALLKKHSKSVHAI